jgi:dCTP deaminase
MMLADREILEALKTGRLRIDPFPHGRVQPASVDVLLGDEFAMFHRHEHSAIDPRGEPERMLTVKVGAGEAFYLQPGAFVLGHTVETIELADDLAGQLVGKSTLGRLGLLPETAGFIDPGFRGQLTLELLNVNDIPIKLWPGMEIAQICLEPCSSAAINPYGFAAVGSRYQNQRGPVAARRQTPAGAILT